MYQRILLKLLEEDKNQEIHHLKYIGH